MDPITRFSGRLTAAGVFQTFLLLALAFSLIGCAGVNTLDSKMAPKDMYESAMRAYLDGQYEGAESSFKTLLEEYPLSEYALDAQLKLGDVCFDMARYDDASAYYTSFVALHPMHPRASYALFQKGMSHFKEVLSLDRDQTATRKSLFAFEDLAAAYPDSPYYAKSKELIKFLRARLAQSEFYVANFYFKNKNYKGALGRLRDILANYPEDGLADKTLYYIGESYRKLGEKSLADEAFTTLIREFPESPFAKEARSLNEDS